MIIVCPIEMDYEELSDRFRDEILLFDQLRQPRLKNLSVLGLPAPMKQFSSPMVLLVPSLKGTPNSHGARSLSDFLVDKLYEVFKDAGNESYGFKEVGN